MTEAYDGPQVVGMDLHRCRSVLVRMTADGRRLETARITNSAAELRREIAKAGQHPKVVPGATYGWYWAADALAGARAEVHLAHPLGVKAFTYRRVKNDEKDAADLAGLLRMGRLAEAWIAPPQVRELRELTRYRIKLVRMRSSGKEQVHAVLAKLGIPVPCPDLFGTFGSAWLDGLHLPQPYAGKTGSLRQLIGWLSGEISLLDALIAGLPGSYPPYHAVRQLPGLGPVLAAVAVAEIGDISRFPGPGHLCSRAGLTPRHRESDLKVARGHITRQGSPILRWAMVEAAGTSPPAARPVSSRTASPPAAAGRRGTSPRPRRPASCSPVSSTRCATGKSGRWPPAPARPRPGEQARTRAARDRLQVWPPPPGGAAAPLIDPAARRGPPHAPAAGNRGNPEGMTAARRLPSTRLHRGAGTQPHTAPFPAAPLSGERETGHTRVQAWQVTGLISPCPDTDRKPERRAQNPP
jgi:transposase